MTKTLTLALAFVLVAALAIGGTVAYLTATTDDVVNTFTVGNVALTLDEKDVTNPDGPRVKANSYKLIPGSEYEKDPTVHVTAGSEACYVFVKVENGLGTSEKASGTDGYVTIADQIAANGWTAVPGHAGYFYKTVDADTAKTGTDLVVFEEFGISGTVSQEAYEALASANITIKACAVQSEGLSTAEAAFDYCPAEF